MRIIRLLSLLAITWSTNACVLPSNKLIQKEFSRRTRLYAVEHSPNVPKTGIEEEQVVVESKKGMGIALAATYFTVMGAKCALPSVLHLLIAPETGLTFPLGAEPQQLIAKQLTLATLAVALGKILLGPIIDRFGGIRSLQVALSVLAVLLATIASCQSFYVFAAAWILVDFIFSSCWAGCINAIHQSFPETEWANRIGTLAAAARSGNAAAFAFFAAILKMLGDQMQQSWRPVFAIAAVAQIIPIGLLTWFGRNVSRNNANGRRSLKDALVAVRKEGKTVPFWLHLISRSMLMVYASFLLFVPTLMSQVYHAGSALAAQTASIYALGCLVAVTFGCPLYNRLGKRGRIVMNTGLLSGSIASSLAQLAHVSGLVTLSIPATIITFFLWGLSFAVPFYIPPSLYALSRGGKQSSATIADVFDIGGFALLALFNGYVASIAQTSRAAWIPTFQITTGCAAVSLVALTSALLRE